MSGSVVAKGSAAYRLSSEREFQHTDETCMYWLWIFLLRKIGLGVPEVRFVHPRVGFQASLRNLEST